MLHIDRLFDSSVGPGMYYVRTLSTKHLIVVGWNRFNIFNKLNEFC